MFPVLLREVARPTPVGAFRFALATASVCGRVGRGLALRSRAPESSPGRLGFRGFRSFDVLRALAMLAAFNDVVGGPGASTRYVPVPCDPSPCPPCRAGIWAGGEKPSPFFLFGIGIDGPSRPRRCPRPTDWRGAGLDANFGSRCRRSFSRGTLPRRLRRRDRVRDAKRRAIVLHDKERWRAGRSFASSPAPRPSSWPRASTRPRWPVDAKTPLKNAVTSLNTRRCWRGRVGWGSDRRLALRSTALTTACPW